MSNKQERHCFPKTEILMKPLFYSLPPAGQKLSLKALINCMANLSADTRVRAIDAVKRYLNNDHVLYLSSGRAALWLYLKTISALKPERKQVIIPAYTCPSLVSSVLRAGLIPVLCDNNLEDFGFLLEELENKIGVDTLAVVAVHLYGMPAKIEKIQTLCLNNEIILVEDAAQAFGNTFSENPEMKLGLNGDAGFFSFGRGKPVSILHGGILALKSRDIYEKAVNLYERMNGCTTFREVNYCVSLSLYSFFYNPRFYWIPRMITSLNLGGTVFEPDFEICRGNNMAIALACEMIDSIEMDKKVRGENSKWYSDNLTGYQSTGIRLVPGYPYLRHPLLIGDADLRNRILENLMEKGTGATGSYPAPLNELPSLKGVLADDREYHNAQKIAASIVTLPVHSMVTAKDRESIKKIIEQGSHAH